MDWSAYDAVVVRSVWDYWLRVPAFTAWLGDLERRGVACWNPVSLIRWNLDKRYLRDLEARGVPTVPTLWFDGASDAPEDVATRVAAAGWEDVVVKPFLLLAPFGVRASRRAAIALVVMLHGGIGMCMNLGNFVPAMIAFAPNLLRGEDWDALGRWWARSGRRVRLAGAFEVG